MEKPHNFYSDWYAKNRERLLPVRRKYNKEYSKRPEVIAKARLKNAMPNEKKRRADYKKTRAGKIAEKRYRDNHKIKIKNHSAIRRLQRYNLTPEAVKLLLEKQSGICRICEKSIVDKFHIDHCHFTNRVRGLLCTACNMGLGLFKDSEKLLERAIKYLK